MKVNAGNSSLFFKMKIEEPREKEPEKHFLLGYRSRNESWQHQNTALLKKLYHVLPGDCKKIAEDLRDCSWRTNVCFTSYTKTPRSVHRWRNDHNNKWHFFNEKAVIHVGICVPDGEFYLPQDGCELRSAIVISGYAEIVERPAQDLDFSVKFLDYEGVIPSLSTRGDAGFFLEPRTQLDLEFGSNGNLRTRVILHAYRP